MITTVCRANDTILTNGWGAHAIRRERDAPSGTVAGPCYGLQGQGM